MFCHICSLFSMRPHYCTLTSFLPLSNNYQHIPLQIPTTKSTSLQDSSIRRAHRKLPPCCSCAFALAWIVSDSSQLSPLLGLCNITIDKVSADTPVHLLVVPSTVVFILRLRLKDSQKRRGPCRTIRDSSPLLCSLHQCTILEQHPLFAAV